MNRERARAEVEIPLNEDLEKFAVPYFPESFTAKEQSYLKPFFSNIDKPVFVVQHLPEEVIGALSSRYSRATKSMRRMFLDEYVAPIVDPKSQKGWDELDKDAQDEALATQKKFTEWIDYLNTSGGIDEVVNVQRGRKFFDTWLAQFGDDSIAEMGGVHLCIEGLSNIATKVVEDKRVGLSPLEKSSRYVQFWEKKPDGNYQYFVPGEIKGTASEQIYIDAMDRLFDTYSNLAQPYLDYIKEAYPIGEDETERSFEGSRAAKRFDDIRDLLPFGTQTQVALNGNGRAYEDLINRMADHPLGEIRWWAQAICDELEAVVPSFVRRPRTERGAKLQHYRTNIDSVRQELAQELDVPEKNKHPRWVKLVSYTPDADVEILSTFIFGASDASLSSVRSKIEAMGKKKRAAMLDQILEERQMGDPNAQRPEVRFRKVPRAFENAHFLFEVYGRGGDYRDLHRHRQQTQERQDFTTKWGYDLDRDVLESPFSDEVTDALEYAASAFDKIRKLSPEVAQYVVPFGFIQQWYMNLSAREVYWIAELRTGPQGRPHYREICQQIASQATEVAPSVFSGMRTDFGNYGLSRRESEIRIDRKLKSLGK